MELVRCGRISVFDISELALADHVHDLDAFDWRISMHKPLSACMLTMAAVLEPLLSMVIFLTRRMPAQGQGALSERHWV